jgi:hypothetical protein
MRKLTKDDVEFTITMDLEHMPVRGNVTISSDPEANKKIEDEILARLINGDIAAWCGIKVSVKWPEFLEFEEFAYLGCFSFFPEKNEQKQIEKIAEDNGLYDQALNILNLSVQAHIMDSEQMKLKLSGSFHNKKKCLWCTNKPS